MSFAPGNNSANYNNCANWNGQNGNVTTVGSNGGPSFYGTYDQSGNVWEWNEAVISSSRGLRGGAWFNDAVYLSSSSRVTLDPSNVVNGIGFRLASSSSILNPLNLPYFVSVGDINNSNDSTGYGSVSYLYQIAQYQVTNCEYAEFLNAVASTDTYGLYNANMGTDARGGITRNGSSGSYSYSVKANMGNKPVVYVSWFDAARYCNWLHNGKPTGLQNNSTTEDGAYTLNGATLGVSIVRNAGAKYSIPTENEWYKAAYYKGGGTNAGYWAYATQSNNAPTCVSANSIGDGPVNSNYSCEEVSVTPTITPTNSVTPSVTPTTTPTNTVTPSVTPTTTPTNSITPTNTVTPTPTKTPQPTSLSAVCRNSCCYYVCVENYDEYNNCIVNNIVINFEGNTIQNFNNDEYQLLIEGNCVDPFSNTLDIKGSKDDCYGCSIVSSDNNNNCDDNNLFKIVASDNDYKFPIIINNIANPNSHNLARSVNSIKANIPDTNIRCCLIASRTPMATPTNTPTNSPTPATPTNTPTNTTSPTGSSWTSANDPALMLDQQHFGSANIGQNILSNGSPYF